MEFWQEGGQATQRIRLFRESVITLVPARGFTGPVRRLTLPEKENKHREDSPCLLSQSLLSPH